MQICKAVDLTTFNWVAILDIRFLFVRDSLLMQVKGTHFASRTFICSKRFNLGGDFVTFGEPFQPDKAPLVVLEPCGGIRTILSQDRCLLRSQLPLDPKR